MAIRRMISILTFLLSCLPVIVQGGDLEELAISAKVNHLLEESWQAEGIEPATLVDDATFLRRAYLDLTGVIPTVAEARTFLSSDRPDQRRQLVRLLLKKPAHFTHLATLWKKELLPETNRFSNQQAFSGWLRNHFAKNTSYNEMVFELLTYQSPGRQAGRATYQQNNAALFYTSTQLKPDVLAARTSRMFLGVQMECAQCHDHPFDRWKQKDFWGFAAFYAQMKRPANRQQLFIRQVNDDDKGEITLPDTKEVVPPRYLGGKRVEKSKQHSRREQLASWITADENPYFAKATVNRVWSILFGYGMVHPIDDFGDHNPCRQPKVLDMLAKDFIENHYDLKRLIRILAFTKAYQLSSQSTLNAKVNTPQVFGKMAIKSLTGEQLYDCLQSASCKKESTPSINRGRFAGNRGFNQQKQIFLQKFSLTGKRTTEYQSGIPQALTLMNGTLISELTNPAKSDLLIAINDSPFMDDAERVEVLFLATLSRFPKQSERDKYVTYVKSGGKNEESKQALGDVLWVLLNSTEFQLNH